MYITIFDKKNRPIGIADSRKLQRVNVVDDKLCFIFDNNLTSHIDFGHPPYEEMKKVCDGLAEYDINVNLYGVVSREFGILYDEPKTQKS